MRLVCIVLAAPGLLWAISYGDVESDRVGGHTASRQSVVAPKPATKELSERWRTSTPDNSVEIKATDGKDSLAIFRRRILPILQAAKPSSCTECHLSGVDLKDYIRQDQAQTFAALRKHGLIDLKRPDKSKILAFIRRKPENSSLITEQVRQQEYEAFRAWILAAVQDPKLLQAEVPARAIGPALPPEVIRHTRRDRVLASFIDNIWSEVGRCATCHSPDRNQKQVAEHGEGISWIKVNDPQATLRYLVKEGLIDTDSPETSLLLTKPTLQVEHGGGQKMVVGDRTYKQFRRFIKDYAVVVNGSYSRAEQLPSPADEVSAVSEIWLKLENVPARYDQLLLRVDIYRAEGDGWSSDRWATGDRLVAGDRNLWQQHLSLTAPRGSARARKIREEQRLPPGKYQLKIYIDRTRKLQKNYLAEFGEKDLIGTATIESQWSPGYGRMTVVPFPVTAEE